MSTSPARRSARTPGSRTEAEPRPRTIIGVDDQQATLAAVYGALVPGGRFVFDVFVPNFDLIEATYGEWQTEALLGGVEHELHRRTRFVDEPRQLAEVENELRAPGGAVGHESSHRISLLPYQQVELLARASTFESWSVDGGFDGEPSGVLVSVANEGSRDEQRESLGARRSSSEFDSDGGGDLEDGDAVQVWTLEREP